MKIVVDDRAALRERVATQGLGRCTPPGWRIEW